MFNNIHIEAVHAQMQNFSLVAKSSEGIEQVVGYVGDLRSMKLQQGDGVESKSNEAGLDGSPHAGRREILAPFALLIRARPGFGRNHQIVFILEAGKRPA